MKFRVAAPKNGLSQKDGKLLIELRVSMEWIDKSLDQVDRRFEDIFIF